MIDRTVDFETAELFVLVAETGSLAAAARARNISPSLVSRIITKLEGELRTQLLNRTTRKLVLTESGQTFLAWSREMIASRERILREIDEQQHEPRGLIRIAIEPLVAAFYLPELMRRFSAQYPAITLRIEACDDPPSMLDGRADLAIHAGPLPSDDVYGQQAYEYRRRLIAAPSYIQAHGAPATPQELLQHRCLTHRSPHSRTWAFRAKDGSTASLELEPYVETNSWFLLRSLVLRGLGIMRMGAPLAESDIRSGLVVPVLEDYDVLTPDTERLSVWVVHANRQRPRRLQLFSEFAVRYLRGSVSVKEFEGDLSMDPKARESS
jgi:DNA-binding transcriptional LysR family regulator